MPDIARRSPADLKPLATGLSAEVLDWAVELRTIWAATGLSMNQFASLHPIDKGTISRYLNGQRIPRDRWFLDKLLAIQADYGQPVTPAVREHLTELQLRALEAAHPHEYRVRRVSDELEIALTGKLEAERYARALEEQLVDRNRQVSELAEAKGRLRAAWDADRVAMQADCERLTREIDQIAGQLHLAQERAAQAERRCRFLEDLLDDLDAHAAIRAGRLPHGGSPSGGETTRPRPDQRDIAAVQARRNRAGHRARDGQAPQAVTALPADGQICALFAVDIAGFTGPHRDDDIRLYLREELYQVLHKAFDGSGIPWAECFCEDRGDGALVVLPPGISAKGLIDPLPERLRTLVRRHNRVFREAAGLQLRAAAHIGPVEHDGRGFVGSDVNLLFRMLDARPFKRALTESGTEVGLVVSDYVYRNLVCSYPGLVSPDAFRAVRFQVKRTRTWAWTYLPGQSLMPPTLDADGADLRPGPHEADNELKFSMSLDTPRPWAGRASPSRRKHDDHHAPQLAGDLRG